MKAKRFSKPLLLAALIATAVPALQGCFPVVATGVAVGVLAALDRRTVGTQTEDESIEWKSTNRIEERFKGSKLHVNVTSYNLKVLVTGEVPDEQTKNDIAEIVRGTPSVHGVWNEVTVGPVSSLSGRSNDSFITSKVKARFVDTNQFSANHVKVVTEAGAVFLMGLVTEREAKAAIQAARTTDGVRKVVNILEVHSDEDIKRMELNAKNSNAAKQPAPVEERSR